MKTTLQIFLVAAFGALVILAVETGLIWYLISAWVGTFFGFVTAAMISRGKNWDIEYYENRNQGLEDKILELETNIDILETQKAEMEFILNKTQDKLDVKDALLKNLEDSLEALVNELEDNRISVIQEKRERAKEFLDSSSIDELDSAVRKAEVEK